MPGGIDDGLLYFIMSLSLIFAGFRKPRYVPDYSYLI